MSVRFQRTPLIAALLLFIAAGALFYFVGSYAALLAGGGGMLLLALSMLGGGRSNDAAEETVEATPTVPFGPASSEPAAPQTRAEKKAAKKAEAEAKKQAAADAKFAKKAEAEAKSAAKKAEAEAKKQAAADAKAAKKAEAEAKKQAAADAKSTKKGRKAKAAEEHEAGEEWIAELKAMNEERPTSAGGSPFGVTVETLAEVEPVAASPRTISFDDTGEIPVVPSAPAFGASVAAAAASYIAMPTPPSTDEAAPAVAEDAPAEDWAYEAYRDGAFVPPFTAPAPVTVEESTSADDALLSAPTTPPVFVDEADHDYEDAVLVEESPSEEVLSDTTALSRVDEGIFGLPAEVDTVFADDTSEPLNPALTIKRMADRFQDLATEINHEWTHITAVYEQRDQLIEALRQAHAENASLRAEMTKAIESGSADEVAALTSSLDEARNEVTRLYEDAREVSRLKYVTSQNVTRLRELRFRIASDPAHDPALLAVIDAAISESE